MGKGHSDFIPMRTYTAHQLELKIGNEGGIFSAIEEDVIAPEQILDPEIADVWRDLQSLFFDQAEPLMTRLYSLIDASRENA